MTRGGRWGILVACVTAGFAVGIAIQPWPWLRATTPSRVQPLVPVPSATLWLLAFGVSQYREDGLALRYASADARAIASAFELTGADSLYARSVTRAVVDEEVTRDTILDALREIVAGVKPSDVVALFFAGHGMIDPAAGGYYFLTADASAKNLPANALRLSDLDGLIRQARLRCRGVVLLFDTCYAGAAGFSRRFRPASEIVSGISAGEGMFLLAAARPGETAQEHSALSHGVFTHAILTGLKGGADGDRNGVVSVSELFGYVAQQVPQLTADSQNPYYKLEGTDLQLVSVAAREHARLQPRSDRKGGRSSTEGNRIAVLPFRNLGRDRSYRWFDEALRVAFTTELSKVTSLNVYAPEILDATARSRSTDEFAAARYLGIDRLISGSFSIVDGQVRIDAWILAVDEGVQEGSDSVAGKVEDFFDLERRLVVRLLRHLPPPLLPESEHPFGPPSNTDVDAYRLLLESEDALGDRSEAGEGETPAVPPSPVPVRTPTRVGYSWPARWPTLLAAAFAAELTPAPEAVDQEVRGVLDAYRRALEDRDIDRLESLYAEPSLRRAELQRQYLTNADGLRLEIVDIVIEPHPEGLLVAFTRRDTFVDRRTGRLQHLEVRLTRLFRRKDGQWKIFGRP